MPQPRQYPNNAARQRAYRERKKLGLVSPPEARNQSRWLALVSEYGPGVRRTAYEIAAALARGHHPTDAELARRVGVGRDTIIAYRQILKRDGLLAWTPGVGRGGTNSYVLTRKP